MQRKNIEIWTDSGKLGKNMHNHTENKKKTKVKEQSKEKKKLYIFFCFCILGCLPISVFFFLGFMPMSKIRPN
jgi:hypothetical protein